MPTHILSPKDPMDRKDYGVSWSNELAAESELALTLSVWGTTDGQDLVSDPTGRILSSASYDFTADDVGKTIQIVEVGNTPGETFTLGAYPIVSVLAGAATVGSSAGASARKGKWILLGTTDPPGLEILAASPYAPYISSDGTRAVVWVSGGTAGERYKLKNTVLTSSATARTQSKSIVIPCAEG